jgi:ATP-dependent DNA helicase RecG
MEKVTDKYFEEGFGTDNIQENQDNVQQTSNKRPTNIQQTSNKRTANVQEEIMEIIKDNPFITRKELEVQLGYSHGKIKYHISQLTKQGIIKHEGATKSGKWVIIQND